MIDILSKVPEKIAQAQRETLAHNAFAASA